MVSRVNRYPPLYFKRWGTVCLGLNRKPKTATHSEWNETTRLLSTHPIFLLLCGVNELLQRAIMDGSNAYFVRPSFLPYS